MANSESNASTGTFYLEGILKGGIVSNPETAIKVAHVLLEAMYGESEAKRQEPFVSEDKGENWVVRGSYNLDKKFEGSGPFVITIVKKDCRVIDAHIEWVTHIDPTIRSILNDRLNKD